MCDFYALRHSAVRQRVLPRVTLQVGYLSCSFVGAIRAHFGADQRPHRVVLFCWVLLGFTLSSRTGCVLSGRLAAAPLGAFFSWVLLGFTLSSRVGCVQRSQRRLRARSHRPQHRPEKGGWLREGTGRDSFRQRCDRTCEIHLGANRQELMYF